MFSFDCIDPDDNSDLVFLEGETEGEEEGAVTEVTSNSCVFLHCFSLFILILTSFFVCLNGPVGGGGGGDGGGGGGDGGGGGGGS